MGKIEQTKGYVFLLGKVFGIDKKEPNVTDYKSTLKIRIKTSKDNTVFATVGGWNNSPMKCKLKAKGMDKAEEFLTSETPEILADYFKDGDSVLVKGTINVNTYNEGRLDVEVGGIYATTEEIDFDADNFEERNEITIPAIVSGAFDGNVLPVKFANYRGEDIDQKLRVEANIIKDFLAKEVGVGDLIPVVISIKNVAIYKEVQSDVKSEVKERTTLTGKKIGGDKFPKREIVGNDNYIELIDIDVEKIEKCKYKLDTQDSTELPF